MSFLNKNNLQNEEDLNNSLNNTSAPHSSLWARIFKNKENQVYSEIIIKGFVWVLMFVISLIALIIVFKDSGKKEVVIVSNKEEKNIETLSPIFTESEENKFLKTPSVPPEDTSKDNKPVKKSSTSKEVISTNSKTTNIEKENKVKKLSPIEENDSLDKLIRNSTTVPTVEKKAIGNKNIFVPSEKKVTSKDKSEVKAINNVKVWLVTIYSASEEALAKVKWQEIESSNSALFKNKKPYFIKTHIENKGIYYRVSLGEVNNKQNIPFFSNFKEAANYCEYLKNNNVNCFVTESTKANLSNLLNK